MKNLIVRPSILVLLFAFVAIVPPAKANDGAFTLGAGGLEPISEADIRIDSEKLFVSQGLVRVEYEFMNAGNKDKTITVAFPLPEIKHEYTEEYGDVAEQLRSKKPEDVFEFSLMVDGKSKSYNIEKTTLCNGAVIPEGTPKDKTACSYLVRYHWQQKFPAGKTVRIVHTYTPILGGFFLGTDSLNVNHADPDMAKTAKDLTSRYCLDSADRAEIYKHVAAHSIYVNELEYILVTAKTWSGPIRDFELTVEKQDPGKRVILCADNIKKISPTRFQVKHKNFVPDKNLFVIFY